MERIKKSLTAIAAVGGLAVIGSIMSRYAAADSSAAADPNKDVVISNVPLPVTGTVAASQSGAWNVGIQGNPNVTVANPGGNPVQVRDVNEASQPVVATDGFTPFENANGLNALLYTVPAGKRLVIEYFSGLCNLPPGQAAIASIRYQSGGILRQHWLTMSPPAPPSPFSFTSFGGPLRAYVDPGITVESLVITNANTTNIFGCDATISGHLVNVQ
jgi:hypothetical protein